MIRLLKKLVLFIIAFLIFDFIIGLGLSIIRDNAPDGRYFNAQHTLGEGKEDIVIFGASCGETDIVPYIIEDSLKMTCWNSARGGQGMTFWMCMELGILKRYTPKIAIVELGEERLKIGLKGSYKAAGILRPFYHKYKEIQPILNEISFFEKYFIQSNLYKYNSSFYYLFRPYLFKGLDGDIADKGWKPRNCQMSLIDPKLVTTNTSEELNPESVEYFNKFISNLTDKGCKVFVVFTPNFNENLISTSTIEYVKNMKNVQLINYDDNVLFSKNSQLYCDQVHLNKEGAIKYTSLLVQKIKKTYSN
jgi:hypothetical protein